MPRHHSVEWGDSERLHFQSRGCCKLHQLREDEPQKTDDALFPGDKMMGDDNVPNAYGEEDRREDPQDDEDVH